MLHDASLSFNKRTVVDLKDKWRNLKKYTALSQHRAFRAPTRGWWGCAVPLSALPDRQPQPGVHPPGKRKYMLMDAQHQPLQTKPNSAHFFLNRWPRDAALKVAARTKFYPMDGQQRANEITIYLREVPLSSSSYVCGSATRNAGETCAAVSSRNCRPGFSEPRCPFSRWYLRGTRQESSSDTVHVFVGRRTREPAPLRPSKSGGEGTERPLKFVGRDVRARVPRSCVEAPRHHSVDAVTAVSPPPRAAAVRVTPRGVSSMCGSRTCARCERKSTCTSRPSSCSCRRPTVWRPRPTLPPTARPLCQGTLARSGVPPSNYGQMPRAKMRQRRAS